MRFIFLFYFLSTFVLSYGQSGTPYLKNYDVPLSNINPAYNDIIQLPWSDILLANEQGLIIYNGTSWKRIQINDKPRVLFKTSDENPLFLVGSKNSFGVVTFQLNRYGSYKHLVDTIPDGVGIINIKEDEHFVYFQTSRSIYVLNKLTQQLQPARHKLQDAVRMISLQNKVFVLISDKLFLLEGGTMHFKSSLIVPEPIIDDVPFSADKSLLLSREGGLYLFNGEEFKRYKTNAENYLKGNYITGGISISENKLAISTLTGGIVLLEKASGKSLQYINYQTGLPDDEITALCTDNQEGVWICHGLGISRADLNLPVSDYSQYPGLAGDITCFRKQGLALYVGTNEGLFYLSRVQDISEVSFLIKKETKSQTNFQTYRRYQTINKKVRITLEPKDTGRYNPVVEEVPFSLNVPYDSVVSKKSEQFIDKVNRQEYALQSIPYIFKKFPGLEGRCNQLIFADSILLVATNKGLFKLDQMKLSVLISGLEINYIKKSAVHPNYFFAATEQGIIIFLLGSTEFRIIDQANLNHAVSSISETQNKLLTGAENNLIGIELTPELTIKSILPVKETSGENIVVNSSPDSFLWISGKNSWELPAVDELSSITNNPPDALSNSIENVLYAQSGYIWTYSGYGWKLMSQYPVDSSLLSYLNIFQEVKDIYLENDSNLWLVKNEKIYRISKPNGQTGRAYNSRVASAHDRVNNKLPTNDIKLKYNNNSVYLNLATPFFLGEKTTQYRYHLNIPGTSWTGWSSNPEITIQYLKPGSYKLTVQAKNVLGEIFELSPINMQITPPFYRSWWFILLVIIAGMALIRLIILYRTKALERENRRLQRKVDEATAEIVTQKDHIEKLYKNIRSSINYAERIQHAILPKKEYINKVLPDSFLLFKPQDVVSGDFYWFHDTPEYFIFIASDCTGHGVPGAFMSMIGNTLLNQTIKEEKIIDPAKILYRLDRDIIASLQQDQESSELRDGMDLAICTYFKKTKELHFGGAMNSLYLFQHNELQQVAADLNPVGGVFRNMKKEFNTHIIPLKTDSIIYIFSDGYYDQLGGDGPRRQKFNAKRFKEILAEIKHKDFSEQEEILDQAIQDWLGERKQNDDILVIGFKLKPGDF